MQVAIGRRWTVVVTVIEEPTERWTSGARGVQATVPTREDAGTLRLERERSAAAAMAWWYGLYGATR